VEQGYVRAWGGNLAEPVNAELEAAIRNDPNACAPYLVYGDWLSERGDPRGPFIAVQGARLDRPDDEALKEEERRLLGEHESALLGELAGNHGPDEGVALEWYAGFLRKVVLGGDPYVLDIEGVCGTLVHLPSAKFLSELTVSFDCRSYGDPPDIMRAFDVPPSLRSLTVVLRFDSPFATPADLSRLYPKLAQLEDLRIDLKDVELGTIALPELRRLELRADLRQNVRSLATAALPKLTTLLLFDTTPAPVDFAPILESGALGTVRHLALGRRVSIAALLGAPVVKHLETLDLSRTRIDDAQAEALISSAGALKHLESLDLSENRLSKPVAERLVRALDPVRVSIARREPRS